MLTKSQVLEGLMPSSTLGQSSLEEIMDFVEAESFNVRHFTKKDADGNPTGEIGEYLHVVAGENRVSIRINNDEIPVGLPIEDYFAYPVYSDISKNTGKRWFTLSKKAESTTPVRSMTVAEIRAALTKGKSLVG
jgi:hypothetical protein